MKQYWNFSNGNFEGHKFSKLKEINIKNISQLKKPGHIKMVLYLRIKTIVR